MYYTDIDQQKIKDCANNHLLDVIEDFHQLRKSGASYICDCPKCNAAKKFSINPAKNVFG